MSNKHTPGPWGIQYSNGDTSAEGQWYNSGPAKVEFLYNCTQKEHDEAEANARLISTAPEMYDMLKNVYHNNDGHIPFAAIAELLNKIDQP